MEILSVSNQYDMWFFVAMILVVSVFLWAGVVDMFQKKKYFGWITLLIIIIGMYFGSVYASINQSKKQELKVIIHNMDEVDFEKYKIMSNEGKIITLREK